MTEIKLIDYFVAVSGLSMPTVDESRLLDYVLAANGVIARGKRPGLEVWMPISFSLQRIRGLVEVESRVTWDYPKVPAEMVQCMIKISKGMCDPTPREVLFYLDRNTADDAGTVGVRNGWCLRIPEQHGEIDAVVAIGSDEANGNAMIEVHSHHSMQAEFSAKDNRDESQGFRVYAVLGTIFEDPRICVRIGLFGHFWEFVAENFFELPDGLKDRAVIDAIR